MHSLIQSRPQTQPHHHHHHHHRRQHHSHRHHRNHHHNHHRCWHQHCFQHHLSLIYRQHHRQYDLSPSFGIITLHHDVNTFVYTAVCTWYKRSPLGLVQRRPVSTSCTNWGGARPSLIIPRMVQVASPEVPWSSEWQSFSVAVWAVNLQTFSFMWLIRAIDCSDSYPCLQFPNQHPHITDRFWARFCLQLWQGLVEHRPGRFCPADALVDASLALLVYPCLRKLAFPKPRYRTTHQNVHSIRNHQHRSPHQLPVTSI